MKTLKFRAWNAGNNEWMNNRDIRIFLDGSIAVYDNTPLSPDYFPKYYPLITIMQYTGLLDKNGKKIYEGDIVKECEINQLIWDNEGIVEECPIGIVYWNEPCACFNIRQVKYGKVRLTKDSSKRKYYPDGYTSLSIDSYDGQFAWSFSEKITVIGNIYEHKYFLDNK